MKSGFFFKDKDGTVDLVFSDKDGACDDAKEGKLHPGETLLQLYTLSAKNDDGTTPAAVGKVFSTDVKFAVIKETCASGSPLGDEQVDKTGRVADGTTPTMSFSVLTDTAAEGSLDIKFDDGSAVSGIFKLTACAAEQPEKLTCR